MRKLNAREEFCLWAGREGLSVSQAETLMACSAKLHRLATEECNGFRTVTAEEKNALANDKTRRAIREALDGTAWSAETSDGWLTTRLNTKAESKRGVTGRAVPR